MKLDPNINSEQVRNNENVELIACISFIGSYLFQKYRYVYENTCQKDWLFAYRYL